MPATVFQTIKYSIQNNHMSEDLICRYGELGRVIKFVPDENEFDPVPYCDRIVFRMFKPDGNFYVQELDVEGEDPNYEVMLFMNNEQITAAAGKGKFDIAFYANGSVIYSCDGNIIIDTPVMTEDTIVSVSEIFGYVFPDDFQLKLTAGANIFISDDNVISATGGGGGGSYVGGNYISIVNDVIDANTTLLDMINGKMAAFTCGTYVSIINGVLDVNTTLLNLINGKQAAFTTGTYVDIVNGVLDINSTLLNLINGKEDSFTTGTYVEIVNGVLDVNSTLLNLINGKANSFSTGTYLDLTNGVLDVTTSLITTINSKQDTLTPGTYISITGSTIDLTSAIINTINGKQDALTAGTGLEIVSNVIGLTQTIQDTINSKISISALADDYDELSTYDEGDYVVINNALYQCNTDIDPAHAYDPTEWTAVPQLCDKISMLEASAAALTSAVSDLVTLMGTDDISTIGDGTVTGAITTLNSTLTALSIVSSSTGYTGITLYKDGLNNITIDFKNADLGTISGSSWTTILNSIPSGYRPSHDVYLPLLNSTLMYVVYISASTGRVDMRSFDGTSHTVSSCNSQVNYRSV